MKRVFTLAAVVGVGGCSLFGFDGFSGGADPDAGTSPNTDATVADAPATPGDGSTTNDGGADAPAGPFCKTVGADASLCDDFEEPGTFTGKWPENDFYLGSLEVLDGIGFGGSRGLRFEATPRNDGKVGQDARVILGRASPDVVQGVDCEVAVKLTAIPTGLYLAGPMFVQFDRAAGGRQSIGFFLDENRVLGVNPIVFGSNGEVLFGGVGKNVTTLPLDTWTRVRIVANAGASPPSLFVYVDGALKNEIEMTGFTADKVTVRLGANFAGGTSETIKLDLDDAKISWK